MSLSTLQELIFLSQSFYEIKIIIIGLQINGLILLSPQRSSHVSFIILLDTITHKMSMNLSSSDLALLPGA